MIALGKGGNTLKTHVSRIRTRYAETDQMGAIYNSHYLTYFEVGRTEYLRDAGFRYRDLEARGVYLVVSEAHCKYRTPARYDEVLTVTTWVDRVRPTRIDFRHRLAREEDGTVIADGHLVLACIGANRRPQPLPDDVKQAIEVVEAPDA